MTDLEWIFLHRRAPTTFCQPIIAAAPPHVSNVCRMSQTAAPCIAAVQQDERTRGAFWLNEKPAPVFIEP